MRTIQPASSGSPTTSIRVTEGGRAEDTHLLTVQEVAEMLRVPASWVYGRTRRRSLERIPAYRIDVAPEQLLELRKETTQIEQVERQVV